MSTLTKEWLLKTIAELEEERDATPGAVNEDAAMALAAMKLALASLEAEAVCVIDQSNLDYLNSGSDADVWPASRKEMGDVLLYRTAPPAPVSVPAAMEMDDDFDSAFEHGKAVGWNAYRAAMLQSFGNSEQLNSPVIPDGWKLVPVEPTEEMNKAGWTAMNEHDAINPTYRAMLAAAPDFRENAETSTKCWCRTCRPVTVTDSRFVVCPECGNKRCPRANDHRNACTGSNEPGQEGSAYPAAPQQEA
ncbi:hypothetical protein [Enterobacter hormaechei]|uniref:hypothetical protein n=1 Tax=Enterobacter hormaechei TaxID=158836 RepID=UPI00166B500B|nr:hypothetical protein [Enterobacter hormaechei]